MSIHIEPFDANTADEEVVVGVHLAYLDMEDDFIPGDATPLEQNRRQWKAPGGTHRKDLRYVAVDDKRVVGACHVAIWDDHPDSGLITVCVRRSDRRQGIGTQLLVQALDALADEGRTKLIVDIPNDSPMETAATELGLKRALSEKISRLFIEEIDWNLMDLWIEKAAERAADYELLCLQPPIPEEHMDEWCKILEAMNTAPLEDLELNDETMTPEKWRSIEISLAARDIALRGCVAIHQPTGEFAGLTTVTYQKHHPAHAWQGDTVVAPDHRNKGLGRLLKASMAKRFVGEFPDVEWIDTGNAGSNEPMLNINIAMGFKPVLMINAWQGEIAKARQALQT